MSAILIHAHGTPPELGMQAVSKAGRRIMCGTQEAQGKAL
jgi:hypothetical protein